MAAKEITNAASKPRPGLFANIAGPQQITHVTTGYPENGARAARDQRVPQSPRCIRTLGPIGLVLRPRLRR